MDFLLEMHEFFYPNYYYYRSRRLKPPQQGAWRTRSRVSAGWSSWWCPPFASTSKPATSSSASTWYSRENTVIRVMQAPECKTHINLRHSKRLEKLVLRVSPFLCLDKKILIELFHFSIFYFSIFHLALHLCTCTSTCTYRSTQSSGRWDAHLL